MKDDFGLLKKETLANVDKFNTDLMSQVRGIDAKRKNLDNTVIEKIRAQDQLWSSLNVVNRNLRDLEALTSKHESQVAALQTGKVDQLHYSEDGEFNTKRHLRVEKALGLEPMTKENADGEAKKKAFKKKRASTMMLGEDQLLRKAWTAWIEARAVIKQEQIENAVPEIQKMLKMHNNLLESEKSKLHSAECRVQTLEVDHTKVLEELQAVRKNIDLDRSRWQGMTRGLQAAKKTMHSEGDGAMLPSATRLEKARLPPKKGPLSSLVSQLPGSSDFQDQKTLKPFHG